MALHLLFASILLSLMQVPVVSKQTFPPRPTLVVVEPDGDIKLQFNAKIVLRCNLDTKIVYEYSFTSGTRTIPETNKGGPELVIPQLKRSDTGIYYCQAVSRILGSSPESNRILLEPYYPPCDIPTVPKLKSSASDPCAFTCSYTQKKPISSLISWHLYERRDRIKTQYQTNQTDTSVKFQCSGPGKYTCTLLTGEGESAYSNMITIAAEQAKTGKCD
ncbi:hypothetical protein BaRGS_00006210 [Batillaria attramentaria]|uniref:Ig-like domain-containing protein n=1 Tax=Batillaria attramentaria TaxID=370345 RepID=A0ABD0LTH1_9CAEN